MARLRVVLPLLAVTALLVPAAAHAATFTPNTFDDPDPNPGACIPTGENSTPVNCSLRDAVLAANANPGPDTIVLAAGTYVLQQPINSDTGDTPETGDLDVEQVAFGLPPGEFQPESLTIQGAGADSTTIDANGIDRALESTQGVPVTLTGLTVTGGDAQQNSGGAISVDAPLTLVDSTVTGNTTGANSDGTVSGTGGGIYDAAPDSVSLQNVTISNNVADSCGGLSTTVGSGELSEIKDSTVSGNRARQGGGGICTGGDGRVNILNSTVADNHTCSDPTDSGCPEVGGDAGGIRAIGTGVVSIGNSTIRDNTAMGCGGLSLSPDTGQVAEVKDSTVSRNRAEQGGGICTDGDGRVDVLNSTVAGNHTCSDPTDSECASVGNDGGGIFAFGSGVLTVGKSTVRDNTANNGGGIEHGFGLLRLLDSTLSGNFADSAGGGFDQGFTGYAVIEGTTITGNTANDGGGGGGNVNGVDTRGCGENPFCFFFGAVHTTVTNSTIVGNAGTFGGGLADSSQDDIRLTNVTLNGNTSSDGADDLDACASNCGSIQVANTIVGSGGNNNCHGDVTSQGNNIDRGDTCGFDSGGDRSNLDAQLGALADNGGPTQTEALADGSPAIDAAADNRCPTADQRGVTRPQGLHCDIGAFEVVAKQKPVDQQQQQQQQQQQVIVVTRSEGGDKTPPKLDWTAPSPISVGKFADGFNVSALCNEACSLKFTLYGSTSTAKLQLAGYNHVLARASDKLSAAKHKVLIAPCVRGAKSSKRTNLCRQNLIARAKAAGNPFRVKLVVVATDAAGNRTTDKQFIRVRP